MKQEMLEGFLVGEMVIIVGGGCKSNIGLTAKIEKILHPGDVIDENNYFAEDAAGPAFLIFGDLFVPEREEDISTPYSVYEAKFLQKMGA